MSVRRTQARPCNRPAVGAQGGPVVCRLVIGPIRRRSCLSVPGSTAAMLVKAPTRGADEIIIDLEDAVALSAKDNARATVVATLAEPHYDGVVTAVRVNAA